MKHLFTLLFFMTVTLTAFAQAPEKMSYQAIVRAKDNTLVTNSNVGVKIIIHQGTYNGTTVYQETHTAMTNANGLVSLEIGTGSVSVGTFSTIAWQQGVYFIETQIDATGGSNYNIIGTSQLSSVPYALHAKTADKIVGVNPFKAKVISFVSSRPIASTDISNTIECTATATLTLTSNFSSMLVGDTINLEAHNGAVLTIQASGVSINYTANGKATFTSITGNVKFGLLRKSGENAYVISGQ